MRTTTATIGDLEALAASFRLHLEAANKSPKTITTYMLAVDQLRAFLASSGMPTRADAIAREHIEAFLVHVREATSALTAATQYRGLQQLFKWLHEEGETSSNPMARMKPPRVEERRVPVIPEANLGALLRACSGREFEDRRDSARTHLFEQGSAAQRVGEHARAGR